MGLVPAQCCRAGPVVTRHERIHCGSIRGAVVVNDPSPRARRRVADLSVTDAYFMNLRSVTQAGYLIRKSKGPLMLKAILAVSVGSAAGGLLGWALSLKLNSAFPAIAPGTLVANLLGGYIVGFAIAYFIRLVQEPRGRG